MRARLRPGQTTVGGFWRTLLAITVVLAAVILATLALLMGLGLSEFEGIGAVELAIILAADVFLVGWLSRWIRRRHPAETVTPWR